MKVLHKDGSVEEGPLRRWLVGIRLQSFSIDDRDVAQLARMSDRDLCAHVRQLASRVEQSPRAARSLGHVKMNRPARFYPEE